MPGTSHHSAVAAVPPEEVWGPIQAVRRRNDRQFHRWMPHVNLLYPFRPSSDLAAASEGLAAACGASAAFALTLAESRFFRHCSGRCTLWLAPEPADGLRQLQAALRATFPDCDDLNRFPAGYTPHLSVGQFATAGECQRVRAELQAGWRPVSFTLTAVSLLTREADGPFTVARQFPLGGERRG
jgi:2'-5' RNA ligase